MFKYPDFVVEGTVSVEGLNLPRRESHPEHHDELLQGIVEALSGPFVPLLVNNLRGRPSDALYVVLVSEMAEGQTKPKLTGWLILRYRDEVKLESCSFMHNSEKAFWALNKQMEKFTGQRLTQKVDPSETVNRPPALDFRG